LCAFLHPPSLSCDQENENKLLTTEVVKVKEQFANLSNQGNKVLPSRTGTSREDPRYKYLFPSNDPSKMSSLDSSKVAPLVKEGRVIQLERENRIYLAEVCSTPPPSDLKIRRLKTLLDAISPSSASRLSVADALSSAVNDRGALSSQVTQFSLVFILYDILEQSWRVLTRDQVSALRQEVGELRAANRALEGQNKEIRARERHHAEEVDLLVRTSFRGGLSCRGGGGIAGRGGCAGWEGGEG
jgi:hypothetical protein